MLRGMNSGFYFQNNKVLVFGEVLIVEPKEKKSVCLEFLVWCHTEEKILSSYCCYAGSFW